MAPAVEVLFAPATEAFQNDHTVVAPVLDILIKTKGCQGIYYGSALEDKTQFVALIVWETLDAHQALIDDKETYPILGAHLAKAVDLSKLEMFHVHFEPDAHLAPVLDAPFTSYLHVQSRKPGKTAAEVEAPLNALIALPVLPGGHGGASGKGVEKDEHVLLFGWDSPQIHRDSAAREEAKKILADAKEVGDKYRAGHVKLNTYKKYGA